LVICQLLVVRDSGKIGLMKSDFEKLRFYQLSEQIADQIWTLVMEWQWFAKRTIGMQLARAADSIGANIAEGVGRGSYADNERFVRTARGSLNETKHFLRRAYKRGLLKTKYVNGLKPLVDELSPKLNSYLKSIGRVPSDRSPSQPSDE
jgi:four helix bundle protein